MMAATRAAMYREIGDVVAIWVCDITHPALETLRIVNNTEDVTVNGDVYTACGFEFRRPEERERGTRPASVRINNADLWLTETLRRADHRVRLRFRLVSGSNLLASPPAFDYVEVPLQSMRVSEVSMNGDYADIDLVYDSLGQDAYPPDRFDQTNYRQMAARGV